MAKMIKCLKVFVNLHDGSEATYKCEKIEREEKFLYLKLLTGTKMYISLNAICVYSETIKMEPMQG